MTELSFNMKQIHFYICLLELSLNFLFINCRFLPLRSESDPSEAEVVLISFIKLKLLHISMTVTVKVTCHSKHWPGAKLRVLFKFSTFCF